MMLSEKYKSDTRSAQIYLCDEVLHIKFYEADKFIGEIEYPNKTFQYVKDAASNWIEGIMTKEVVEEYRFEYPERPECDFTRI